MVLNFLSKVDLHVLGFFSVHVVGNVHEKWIWISCRNSCMQSEGEKKRIWISFFGFVRCLQQRNWTIMACFVV